MPKGKKVKMSPDKSEEVKDRTRTGFHARVIVKFRDTVELPYEDGAEKYLEKLGMGPWKRLSEIYPGLTLRPLLTALKPEQIRELVARAQKLDSNYDPPNLLTYYLVEGTDAKSTSEVAAALREWSSVQFAYPEMPAMDPVVSPEDDTRWPDQGYLDPSGDGIDAEYAWGFPGGDGEGQSFIDLEQGWTLNHEDLAAHGAAVLFGSIVNTSRYHGTAVLGEICAVDNALGCVGIVPNIASVNVVSHSGSTANVPNAVLTAIDHLAFGNVLLFEVQIDFLPCESDPACFDVIRLATALGIVCVEAAGNGSKNLNTFDAGGLHIFDRTSGDFRDSGAIVVGASDAPAPHPRRAASNFGNRIDCFAWGRNVNSCSSDGGGATNLYTTNFLNTSAASPIIAGAALSIQGLAEHALGYRFSPLQLRSMMSDPANGTASNNPVVDQIGVMPNLRAFIDGNILGLAPDIYLRDFVGDSGDPHSGLISASPDIIIQPSPVADPQASFGEGSGTENNSMLGYEFESGQDNHIYVRARNRGGSLAVGVSATVYWSDVATLIGPDLWHLIGSVALPDVPTGNQLTVSGDLTWPKDNTTSESHACLVGILSSAHDPAPIPSDFTDFDDFRRFIRDNNNVTWRNFNVVNNEPDPDADPAGYVSLPFMAPGAFDRARFMRLEIMAQLPRGAQVLLEAPEYLASRILISARYQALNEIKRTVRMPIKPHGIQILGEILFPAKSRSRLRLLVKIPEAARRTSYEIAARQVYEKQEVGRVTWRLVPKQPRKKDRLAI